MDNVKKILELNKKWDETDSNTIADHVEDVLIEKGYDTAYDRIRNLADITNSSEHAVYAWLNHGRTNVKIPFLKLCMISDALDVDINKLLAASENTFEKKFAVIKYIGEKEHILKYFDEDNKASAIAYGAEAAKEYPDNLISCILARFDKKGNVKYGQREVFEVWKPERFRKEIEK